MTQRISLRLFFGNFGGCVTNCNLRIRRLKTMCLVEEFESERANKVTTVRDPDTEPRNSWQPSPQGFIKVNTDAAVLPRRVIGIGAGGVARDEHGTVLWLFSEKVTSCMSVDEAEAYAMLRGIIVIFIKYI
ncbi:hypothetical protein OROMI_031130 [Orobanche minor]